MLIQYWLSLFGSSAGNSSRVTAAPATSATAAREVYQATSAVTATAGTCYASDSGSSSGTCACTASPGACLVAGGVPTQQPRDERILAAPVSKKTLKKFARRYASVKGVANLKPKRKARHKARGRQLVLASATNTEEPSQQSALAVFIPLPVFSAVAELRQSALTSHGRGAIRIAGKSEIGRPVPMIEDDDIAILMMLAA